MKCKNCGFENLGEAKYCGMCGELLRVICPVCNYATPQSYRFCIQCGFSMEEVTGLISAEQSESAAQEIFAFEPPGRGAGEQAAAIRQLRGERRIVTVMFADIHSSTNLLERMGTEAWVDMMNGIFQVLETEIYRLGGEIDQFRGDGLVAVFGAHAAHEDDPERAVLAGLSMQRAFSEYVSQFAGEEMVRDLGMRIGINTGEVIATSIGDGSHHREDTTMGEALALAARIEAAAEPGVVLVSESTYHLIERKFNWRPLGELSFKGISRPIAVYQATSLFAGADWSTLPDSFGWTAFMIGRQDEFELLKKNIEALYDRRGGITLVSGEKGMGKSFLIAHVRQYFTRRGALLAQAITSWEGGTEGQTNEIGWFTGRCRSYQQSWPFSMWLDVIWSWLGVREGEQEADTLNRLRTRCQELWGERMGRYYPYLATALLLPLEEEYQPQIKYLAGERLQEQFFRAVWNWLKALAERDPVVIAFADLQWVNPASLELLKYCLPLCETLPLHFILATRLERTTPAWELHNFIEKEYPHRATLLDLQPLSIAESEKWVEQMVGAGTLSKKARALLVEKSEGNPYYIREFIESLVAQDILVRGEETGKWQVTRQITSLDLPDSLQGLLLARIDRLNPDERRLLQMAAVIGNVFWELPLRMLAADLTGFERSLTELQRQQLVIERGGLPDLGMEYAFKSPLMRDVAYESLLVSQRVEYHLKFAESLEECFTIGENRHYYGILAFHFAQAGNIHKELLYTTRAAQEAAGVYANAEAFRYYDRALEIVAQFEEMYADDENMLSAARNQKFELLSDRSDLYYVTGAFQQAIQDARALLGLAALQNDPLLEIDAQLKQFSAYVLSTQTHEELLAGVDQAHGILERSRALDDVHRELACLSAIAWHYFYLNDSAWIQFGEQALSLARELEDTNEELRLLVAMAQAYGIDQLERSLEYVEQALPVAQKADDKWAELELLYLLGAKYERQGDYYKVLTEYEQKRLQISRTTGYRYLEGQALVSCGQIQGLYLGDLENCTELLDESKRIWKNVKNQLFPVLRLAQVHIELARMAEARAALDEAAYLLDERPEKIGVVGFNLVSAMYFTALGEEDGLYQAIALAEAVQRMVDEQNVVSRQYKMAAACKAGWAHLGLANLVEEEGRRREHARAALDASHTARLIFDTFGFTQVIECVSEEVFYLHSLALRANGLAEEADVFLEKAYNELMRKHALIPPQSDFAKTFLENLSCHCHIVADHLEQHAI